MSATTERPPLARVPLRSVVPPLRGLAYVTMRVGQWDSLLHVAYLTGWVLLELDDDEKPIAAYRTPDLN